VEQVFPGGDHEIVVGRVSEVETGDESAAPLLYWQGTYGLLARTADRAIR
jgi:flavin reductase (DIM6/NTAB) family NADH-FMN oxidoreductase RutF